MKRFFLDSNVYDEFLKSHELLGLVLRAKSQGLIDLIGTHIEPDELGDTALGDPVKAIKLISVYEDLNVRQVATEGFVLGKSRLDEATLFSTVGAGAFDELTASNPDHSEDVLMILTAQREMATFVTEETKRIPRLCIEIGIECINAQALGDWCYQKIS